MDQEIRSTATAVYDGKAVVITIPKQYIREILTNPDWMASHSCFKVKNLEKACDYIAENVLEEDEDVGNGQVSAIDLVLIDLALKCWEEGDDNIVVPDNYEDND